MNVDDIIKLVKEVSKTNLDSLEIEEDNLKINLTFDTETEEEKSKYGLRSMLRQYIEIEESKKNSVDKPQIPEKILTEKPMEKSIDKIVTSPLVGTFYSSPSPDMSNFISVGDTVKKGQVIGIVEAMKLMNEVECDFDGVVEEILVSNEQLVEYGQALVRIK